MRDDLRELLERLPKSRLVPSGGFLVALGFIVVFFGGAFAAQWVGSLFSSEMQAVIMRRGSKVRVVKDEQIREVVKWRERTLPCVDLAVLTPREAEADVLPEGGGSMPPKAERAVERLTEAFAGQINLKESWLLATQPLPGSRWGWKVAATIPQKPDGAEPRRVSLTAVEETPPLFQLGERWWWFAGGGAVADQDGVREVLHGQVGRDAFTTKSLIWSAQLNVDVGADKRDRRAKLTFGVGKEHYDF